MRTYTQLNDAVDASLMYPAIYLAQDKYIEIYIGTDLSNYIKGLISAGTIDNAGNEVYATLLYNYIKRATTWWAMVELYPNLYIKHDNGSLVMRTSEDTQTISPGDVHGLMDTARSNAMYYTQRMTDYLCANSSSYPQYSSNVFPDKFPHANVYGRSVVRFSQSLNREQKLPIRYLPHFDNP